MDKHSSLSYFGSFTAFISGVIGNWTLNDIASLCGIIFGLATILINRHYKQKEYELKRLELENKIHEKNNR